MTAKQPPTSPPAAPTSDLAAEDVDAFGDAFGARARRGLEEARAIHQRLISAAGPRDIANTLEPYNQLLMQVERSSAYASLMSAVHPDEAIRDSARACEQDVQSFLSGLSLDRDLYEAFAGLDVSSADEDTKRLVDHTLRDFRRAGVDRDDDTRARIRVIDEELTKLGQRFQNNIIDDVRHIEIRVGDSVAADGSDHPLKGLPDDFIKSHPPDSDGIIRVTTDYPDYLPFASYAERGDLRRELYIASKSRASDQNEDVLRQILALRAEKAGLLGYASWADYATEDKMMKSGARAAEFIERVVDIAKDRAERDYQQLLARKQRDEPGATEVADYEKIYYENKVKSESYAFDPQSVRPYFPYPQVEAGLLDITAEIYDIQYQPAQDAELWHQDVRAFDVVRGQQRVGRIFLDMHPRAGKYKHAAQFSYRSGVSGVQVPEGVLVCNFPNPRTIDGPALMEHGEVVTMFHEFGHLMHHILAGDQRWIAMSGVATEWDFVEAPSQMFEEWAWSHETLRRFARHYDTGEVISAELVERMRAADQFGLGVMTVQQMFYAAVSLTFHTADPAELDMLATVKSLQQRYTPFGFVDGTCFHANFGHLNGYSALYYTYMWSLVIAKDLLTPFHAHGLMNREWTERYRDRVLAPGGSRDAADLVRDFLGRDYRFDAFEAYLAS